jgi:hypothetical protein
MKLNRFNDLPVRPEYLRKLRPVLAKKGEARVADLVGATGLTRTQVLCALEELVRTGEARKAADSLTFSWAKAP